MKREARTPLLPPWGDLRSGPDLPRIVDLHPPKQGVTPRRTSPRTKNSYSYEKSHIHACPGHFSMPESLVAVGPLRPADDACGGKRVGVGDRGIPLLRCGSLPPRVGLRGSARVGNQHPWPDVRGISAELPGPRSGPPSHGIELELPGMEDSASGAGADVPTDGSLFSLPRGFHSPALPTPAPKDPSPWGSRGDLSG